MANIQGFIPILEEFYSIQGEGIIQENPPTS
jgi:hypothetical protein